MITIAPTPTARIAMMRERFDGIMAAVGETVDQLHASATSVPVFDHERAVQATLTRLEAQAGQFAREVARGDLVTAEATLDGLIGLVQGDLLRHLQALAVAEGDPHRAASIRDWADDLAALAESEAA